MWLLTQSWNAQLAACCSGISAVLMWLLREQGGSLASAILLWGWLGLPCDWRQRQVPVSTELFNGLLVPGTREVMLD